MKHELSIIPLDIVKCQCRDDTCKQHKGSACLNAATRMAFYTAGKSIEHPGGIQVCVLCADRMGDRVIISAAEYWQLQPHSSEETSEEISIYAFREACRDGYHFTWFDMFIDGLEDNRPRTLLQWKLDMNKIVYAELEKALAMLKSMGETTK